MTVSSATRQQLIQTGQRSCHDGDGREITCDHSGQDAEFSTGATWPTPRFHQQGNLVIDSLTDLIWTCSANLAEFPLNWQESLDFIAQMNTRRDFGFNDWRLPNRRELRSLISHQTKRLALPEDHPFTDVFGNWYWTSTTAAPALDHAWYINLDGGRMFFGGKDQYFLLWPVRGTANRTIARTG